MSTTNLSIGSLPPCDETELAEFRKQIRVLYDMKEETLSAGNPDPVVERFYAADAVTFGPDAKVISGRSALADHYAHFVANFSSARVESIKQYVRNGVGWDWANFIATTKDGAVVHAPMLFLWVKDSDNWVSAGDVFAINPDGPTTWPA